SGSPWRAFLQVIPAIVRAGFVYVSITETGGTLTAVAGPFFATALPAGDASTVHVPLAQSDGLGGLVQLHSGLLCWTGGNISAALDTDAEAYISAVAAAKGTAVNSTQQAAINAFVLAEKAASRWTAHKRLWLPIWNNAGANSIDMVTRGTWTAYGSVTAAAGYVTPDGSSGYANLGVSAAALGLDNASGGMSVLAYVAASGAAAQTWMGAYMSGTGCMRLHSSSSVAGFECMANATGYGVTLARSNQVGILSAMRFSGSHVLRQRRAAGVTALGANAQAADGTAAAGNLFAMAYNNFGSASGWCNGSSGFFGVHSGLSTADTDAYSDNLKTMWETCSGLTLP
ncbi:MAG: hypothetical protein WCK77_14450, partial [Verrucomicrobiota bacterium]